VAWRAWLPNKTMPPWQAALLGAALAGAAMAVRLAIREPLGHELPFITYFPALIVASALGGFTGGLTCLVAATFGGALLLTAADGSAIWALGSFWIAGGLVVAVGAALADSVRELRLSRGKLTEAQTQLQTLVGELAHRSRNALFVIMAIVSQSARAAGSAAEAERIINDRLEALLRAQQATLQADGASASLRHLLQRALEPFDLERIVIAPAPEVQVESDVAVGLGLLFHELATNALKYGALSLPPGRVHIAWTVDAGFARFLWREVGGPPVTEPSKKGFGARLLDTALVPQGGKAERRFEPEGLVCELRIPEPPRVADRQRVPPPGSMFAGQVPDGSAAN
jgi:two-component sensor histidine kinase